MLHFNSRLIAMVVLAGALFFPTAEANAGISKVPWDTIASQKRVRQTDIKSAETGNKHQSPTSNSSKLIQQERDLDEAISSRIPSPGEPATLINIKSAEKEMNLIKGHWTESSLLSSTVRSSKKRVKGNITSSVMFAKDIKNDGLYDAQQLSFTLISSAPAQFTVKGIYGLSSSITVDVNESEGIVSIASQKIFANSKWGDLYICPVDGNKYDPNGTVVGYFDETGNISFGGWGIFAKSGQYAGYAVAVFTSSKWLVPNSTVKTTGPREQDCTSLLGAIEQENANTVNIFSLLGYNNVIVGTLTPSRTIKITPQKLYTAQAGPVICYPIEEVNVNGTKQQLINYSGNVTGTATSFGMEINPWTAAIKGVGAAYMLESTEITTDYKLTYPAPISAEWGGRGTPEDPYVISNPQHLLLLSQKVEEGNDFSGYSFMLNTDIDMATADRSFTAIGSESTPFNGTFQGNGHAIKNLTYHAAGATSAGLFGVIGESGHVRQLNISGASVTGSGKNIGVLAGIMRGKADEIKIENSTISTTGESTGGLIGQLEGTLSNSSFYGTASGKGLVGGAVGFNAGAIRNSHASATVILNGIYSSTYHAAAGLCAATASSKLGDGKGLVSECYFSGEVRDLTGQSNIGGLVCIASRATIERSFNTGVVQALLSTEEEVNTYAGGLCAYITESYVKDCYNAGSVIGQVTVSASMPAIGGLFGYISVSRVNSSAGSYFNSISKVERCYNSGFVFTTNENPKQGIYGRTWDGSESEIEEKTFDCIYSDSQINHSENSSYARKTQFLTAASLPTGFSSDVWFASAGYYPTLKANYTEPAARLSAATVILPPDLWLGKMRGSAALKADSPVKWGVLDSNGYPSEKSDNISITGNLLTAGNQYSNEVLVAYTPDNGLKMYRLGLVPDKLYQGQGTESDPYLLQSVADWKNLNLAVGTFAQGHEGDFFKMAGDIDFAGSGFNGVGANNQVNTFDGTLDGDGHTINNLSIKAANLNANGVLQKTGNYWHGALFSLVGKTGVLKNINIADNSSIIVYHYGGAIVGQLLGKVENCKNYADVTCYGAYGGGIAGVVRDCGTLKGCYNAGRVYTTNNTGTGAAGIVGYNIGATMLCQNDGEVVLHASGKKDAGGIAAYNSGRVENCVNNGVIMGVASVGGIVGSNTYMNGDGRIAFCVNNGMAMLSKDGITLGGIVGDADAIRNSESNYYDSSINVDGAVGNAGNPAMIGLATTELTGGVKPEKLDSEFFDFTTGLYPSLKSFANEARGKMLRSVHVGFKNGEVRNNMRNDVDLSTYDNLSWSLDGQTSSSSYFSIDNNRLKVTIPTDMNMGSATLNAKIGDNIVKSFDLKAIPVFLSGEGTSDSPYLINNTEDFVKLASFVNTTGNDYKGVSFRLTNDLDFGGQTITMIAGAPVGKANERKFQGIFDGDGKTIKNFVYEYAGQTTAVYNGNDKIGIIGILGEAGILRNLTSEGRFKGMRMVGGLVGELYGRVENCVNRTSVTVTGSEGGGGITGKAHPGAHIENCVNHGDVTGSTAYGTAGIAGYCLENIDIIGCVNEGTITGEASAKSIGGIAGRTGGRIYDCVNRGKIISLAKFSTSPTTSFGGIGGMPTAASDIRRCVNEVEINLPNSLMVGGIIGGSSSNRTETMTLTVDSCINKGNITALGTVGGVFGMVPAGTVITTYEGSTFKKVGATASGYSGYAGGFAGYVNSRDADFARTRISDCFNNGNVTNQMAFTGGFTAYIGSSGIVEGCYNTGNVRSFGLNPAVAGDFSCYQVGGFVGDLYGSIVRCWNSGSVEGDGHDTGGLAGLAGTNALIESCVNTGAVKITSSAANKGLSFHPVAGGIQGRANASKTLNSINFGDVSAPDRVAGLVSMLFIGSPKTELRNSYTCSRLENTGSTTYASNIGNYQLKDTVNGYPELENLFYLKGQNPNIQDNIIDRHPSVKAADRNGIAEALNGDEFYECTAGLPMVKGLKDAGAVHILAAGIGFSNESDTDTNVTGIVRLSSLPELQWSGSDGMEISGNMAIPRKTGEHWLKVTTTDGSRESIFNLTVTKASDAVMPTAIVLDKTEVEASIDDVVKIKATLSPDNVTEDESVVSWTSTDDDVCSVDNGAVTCKSPGTAVITATTVNGLSATCIVTVRSILPTAIFLNEHTHSANIGETFTLIATLEPENCTNRIIQWTSSDKDICTVDDKGMVTILATGEATVTATTANGLTDSCDITGLSGVGAIYADGREIKSVIYHTADGKVTATPENGELYVVKYIFTDGSSRFDKIIYSGK